MNPMMPALAVQLLIYAVAWLALGLGYRLNRRVALCWSLAWFVSADAVLILYLSAAHISFNTDLIVNLLMTASFLLLQHGVDRFAGDRKADLTTVFYCCIGVLLVEGLRQLGTDWLVWRVGLLTLVLCWPLWQAAWQMASWLNAQRNTSKLVVGLVVSPLWLALLVLVLHMVLIAGGSASSQVRFNTDSEFDLSVTLLFLVLLGGFNFSLATLLLGRLIHKLRTLSDTDQLTGLYNRRVMMRRLDNEHARYQRSGQRFAMMMLDIDHFKRINDSYGHGVGDQVLCGLAGVLQACTRQADTLARTGGEEFMLLMPLTDEAGSLAQAQRLCETVANTPLPTDAGALTITVSVGVALVMPQDQTDDRLVSRADAALYRAKEAGRNRVEIAPPD